MISRHDLKQAFIQYAGLLVSLAILVAYFGFATDNFWSQDTLRSIANQIPDLTFIAVGMTLVLVVGGIDLSVGSVLALCGAVVGVLMGIYDWPLWAAFPIAALTGLLCGAINGIISVGFGVPSFIVTLGMLEIVRGATKVVMQSKTVWVGSPVGGFCEPIAGMKVSFAFILACITVVVGQFLLTRTVFGRYCIAIGTNKETVRMSGIRPAPYLIAVFAISGFLCSLAGLASTSRLTTADPGAGIGIELAAIAACVIGGTSLMGGRGSVISTFFGVLIISALRTGLAQQGVSDPMKQIITGTVIIVAVVFDAVRIRWGNRNG